MNAMGSQEIIIILIVLIMLAVPVGIIIALVWYFSTRSKSPQHPPGSTKVQDRLSQLDSLRSQNLITAAEYEEQRRKILNNI